jgi:hypothetical protein
VGFFSADQALVSGLLLAASMRCTTTALLLFVSTSLAGAGLSACASHAPAGASSLTDAATGGDAASVPGAADAIADGEQASEVDVSVPVGSNGRADGGDDAPADVESDAMCHNDPVGPAYRCLDSTTWIAHNWVTRCGGVIVGSSPFPCATCTSDLEDIGAPQACAGTTCVDPVFLTFPWPETPCVGLPIDAGDGGSSDASDASTVDDAGEGGPSGANEAGDDAANDASGP